jgi:uncharacterized membrane protein YqjE
MAEVGQPVRDGEPVREGLRDISDGLGRLVKEHVELAKVELRSSLKKMAIHGSLTGAGAAFLAVGWVLLMFSAAYGLGSIIGDGWAFLIVSGVDLIVGFVLVVVFGRRLRKDDGLQPTQTREELLADRRFLHNMGEIVRPGRHLPA